MRFTWTAEQQLLQATIGKFVRERYSFDYRRRRLAGGFDPAIWTELAELGVLGLPFDEQYGGMGGSALDTVIVMEAFGQGLVVEPYLSSIVLGGGLLRLAGDESQKQQLIPALIEGQLRLAFAFAETQSRFNLANVAVQARASNGGYTLSGRKVVVYGAPEAHKVFVTARTSGAQLDAQGISLFLLSLDAPGLQLRSYRCVDGMTAADVTLDNVQVSTSALIGPRDHALPIVERVIDEGTTAMCAEAIGAMAALNEKCVEYSKARQAFGKPIADFQVIGHRLVDMHVSYEQAAALTLKAASTFSSADSARTVSACKVKVNQEAAFVGKSAVQLHGAIGMTDELDIGHYFKRLMAIQTLFGGSDYHLRRYIQLGNTRSPETARDGH